MFKKQLVFIRYLVRYFSKDLLNTLRVIPKSQTVFIIIYIGTAYAMVNNLKTEAYILFTLTFFCYIYDKYTDPRWTEEYRHDKIEQREKEEQKNGPA